MGRPKQRRGFSAGSLVGVLFLVAVVAGVPVLVQRARAASHALGVIVIAQIAPRS